MAPGDSGHVNPYHYSPALTKTQALCHCLFIIQNVELNRHLNVSKYSEVVSVDSGIGPKLGQPVCSLRRKNLLFCTQIIRSGSASSGPWQLDSQRTMLRVTSVRKSKQKR